MFTCDARVVFQICRVKKRWFLGLRPRPRWGSFQRSPIPPCWAGGVPPSRTLPGASSAFPIFTVAAPVYFSMLRPCFMNEARGAPSSNPSPLLHLMRDPLRQRLTECSCTGIPLSIAASTATIIINVMYC